MSFEPTPTQALLIFGLLARHGECKQAELMPAVKKADREVLVKAKLLEATKIGNAYQLKLNEQEGWAWAGAHLSAELPPAQRALSDMMARLGEYLAKSGETLADFIGAKPAVVPLPKAGIEAAPAPSAKVKKQSPKDEKPKATRKPKPPTPAALRQRIEAAYLKITGRQKNENVKLSHLRRELADLDRPTVDRALARILKGDKTASLGRDDNTRQLDQSDHDAAFNPSGEPFHLIWISS